jgi:dihydrofolate synthase / folylpolyglutamate synthase
MGPVTLAEWLAHAERQHTVGIDLGLDRVTRVAEALGFTAPDHRPAPRNLIIAGTNGKGSTTVFSEALLRARGLRVGATLSPHVHRFNERVRLDGEPVDDAWLCRAFAAVEAARGPVPLTYFEYSALVALWIFRDAAVDVAVLEVGLGGRLDAFNLVGADVAVITSIGLDHEAFLGSDLQGIGLEKAGVMRPGRDVVTGADVTASVHAQARRLGCRLRAMGEAFSFVQARDHWQFAGAAGSFTDLPWGALAPYNCAVAIEAVSCLEPVTEAMVRDALAIAELPGRCEAWEVADRLLLVDVAHNPAGAAFLRRLIETRHPGQRFTALLGMFADKDAEGVVAALGGLVNQWICVPTSGPRGQGSEALAARVRAALSRGTTADSIGKAGVGDRAAVPVSAAADVASGLDAAMAAPSGVPGTATGDGILAFGSFSLVEGLRDVLATGRLSARLRASPTGASRG